MLLLTWAPILTLLVFAGQEVNSNEPKCPAEQNDTWSYSGENGPQNWGNLYPACNGNNQSPINIEKDKAVKDPDLTPINFTGYDVPMTEPRIENNGHTVQVSPTDGVTRSIQGGGLSGTYVFSQLHFHWGNDSKRGSEHLFNGWSFPMEMHLVHTSTEGEKIAVIAVFFKTTKWKSNKDLSPIVEAFSSIQYRGDQTTLESLNLDCLLPRQRNFFYRYTGSLTTPACDEGVEWIIFKSPLNICYKQLKKFRKLYSTPESEENHCHLVNNFRPPQNLNDRTVTFFLKSNYSRSRI